MNILLKKKKSSTKITYLILLSLFFNPFAIKSALVYVSSKTEIYFIDNIQYKLYKKIMIKYLGKLKLLASPSDEGVRI